jgi:hypothetical protein
MNWREFAVECPELSALGESRLRRSELCLVATLRKNGFPRISPCEPDFAADELLLGMMWQSPKARDLIRDSRCTVHSVVADKAGIEGDFKLYGHAVEVADEGLLRAYRAAIQERTGWQPPGAFHLFALDIVSAGFVVFGEDAYGLAWRKGEELRRWSQRLS